MNILNEHMSMKLHNKLGELLRI